MRSLLPFATAFMTCLAWATAKPKQCLQESDVDIYVQAYKDILAQVPGWRNIAHKYLAKDIVSYSDSTHFEFELALNTTHYTNLDSFIGKIESQPPCQFHDIVITHNCNTITAYQRFAPGDGKYPITSISIWFINVEKKKVVKCFWEYNAALSLWLSGKRECKKDFKVSVGGRGLGLLKAGCN